MKKILMVAITLLALTGCGSSEVKVVEDIKTSNAVRIEDNGVYAAFIQKVDTSQFLVVWSRSSGSIAVTQIK